MERIDCRRNTSKKPNSRKLAFESSAFEGCRKTSRITPFGTYYWSGCFFWFGSFVAGLAGVVAGLAVVFGRVSTGRIVALTLLLESVVAGFVAGVVSVFSITL